jgi:hypothetical protein
MSLSKRLAAWHEAGHAIRAFFCRKLSISMATISLAEVGGGRWEGGTGVDLTFIPEARHIDIALAGLMAEAHLNGIEHAASNGVAYLLEHQPGLAATISGYYGMPNNEETLAEMEHTQVQVYRADGQLITVEAATNFADLNLIPVADRTVANLTAAIARIADFFNNDEPWFRVGLLADALEDHNWPAIFDYIAFLRATMLPP